MLASERLCFVQRRRGILTGSFYSFIFLYMTYISWRTIGGAAFLALVPLFAAAATFRTGDAVTMRAGEILEDVYAAAGTVSSGGSINGDLYAGGGTILVTGPVSADAVLGGGTITVTSAIGDDLRVGGGTIVVQGAVGGDVVAGGGQIHLAGSRIGGDVLAGGGIVRIDVPVGQDVRIGGGEVYINAPVAGNVDIEAEKITIGSEAIISGNLTYKSPNEAIIESGAQVRGETTYTPSSHRSGASVALGAFVSVALFIKLLMMATGALFFGLLFNRYSTSLVRHAFAKPLPELGRGLVAFIVLPVVSVLLLITLVGLPLGLLGLVSFTALTIFSCLMAPVLLGSFIYQWFKKGEYVVTWKSILVGVLAYCVIGFVPIVGWLVQAALFLLVLGTNIALKWRLLKEWR